MPPRRPRRPPPEVASSSEPSDLVGEWSAPEVEPLGPGGPRPTIGPPEVRSGAQVELRAKREAARRQVVVGWQEEGGWLKVRTPFSSAFVAELKAVVQSANRRWDGERRIWLVDPVAAGVLAGIMMRHFGDRVEMETGHMPEAVAEAFVRPYRDIARGAALEVRVAKVAGASHAAVVFTWGFPSSGGATVYETQLRMDGALTCNCPGWIFNPKRACTHTRRARDWMDRADRGTISIGMGNTEPPGRAWMGDPDKDPMQRAVVTIPPAPGGRKLFVRTEKCSDTK